MNTDWYIGDSWFDDHNLSVHFELLNSNSNRLVFSLRSITINDHSSFYNDAALDNFRESMTSMLDMTCALVNDGHFSEGSVFKINQALFERYYRG